MLLLSHEVCNEMLELGAKCGGLLCQTYKLEKMFMMTACKGVLHYI